MGLFKPLLFCPILNLLALLGPLRPDPNTFYGFVKPGSKFILLSLILGFNSYDSLFRPNLFDGLLNLDGPLSPLIKFLFSF